MSNPATTQLHDPAIAEPKSASSAALDIAALPRFSRDLPETRPPEEVDRLRAEIETKGPWCQGPFYLGAGLVAGATGGDGVRWSRLQDHVGDLAGRRVLDVSCGAGYNAFRFRLLGADRVVGCDGSETLEQAKWLDSIFGHEIQWEQIGWQSLDPAVHGLFDLIHCIDLVHRDPNPLGVLRRLRIMLADGGRLLLGSPMLDSPAQAEYVRFIRLDQSAGHRGWWIPGRLALRRMMDSAGFETQPLDVPFSSAQAGCDDSGYVQGLPREPDPWFASAKVTADHPDRDGDPANRFPVGHYYSPMYDSREIASVRERVWPAAPRPTPGIDWNDDAQLALAGAFAKLEPLGFQDDPTDDPTEYHARNDQFPALDAAVLASILQHWRPRRMIEVGSGFSTLVSARVNRQHLERCMHLICIEPFPRTFLTDGVDGVGNLRVELIQDTPLDVFSELAAGDVLFVDTAHTVKTGGDVTWIFGEIIPRLAPGVLVHVHDVFLPGDYPEPWVMEGWGWNESYLVKAFLAFNDGFEIIWGNQYMLQNHRSRVRAAFPGLAPDALNGSSLWMRRRD